MCKFTILFPKSSLLVLKISECVFDDAEELLSFYNAYLFSSVRRKVVIVLHSAILIKFPKANYLTFECLLSRNAGDFSGSVDVWVDFFEYLSIKQFIVFQAFAK